MFRHLRPHSLGFITATASRPKDSTKATPSAADRSSNKEENFKSVTDSREDRSETTVFESSTIESLNHDQLSGEQETIELQATPAAAEGRPHSVHEAERNGYNHSTKSATKFEEAAFLLREGEHNKSVNNTDGRWSRIAFAVLHHPAYYITHLIVTLLLVLLALVETPGNRRINFQLATLQIYINVLELVILMYLVIHIFLKFVWFGRKPSESTVFGHLKLNSSNIIQTVVLAEMLLEVITLLSRQQHHIRLTRALRPVFFIDNHLMKGVRRELWGIFKSLKHIVDIWFFLFFVIFLFALMAFYAFAKVDPYYYSSFRRSFVSLYILLTTANNPDVTLKPYFVYPASPLFFFVYFIIAFYFMNNMLLYAVCKSFRDADMIDFKNIYIHKRIVLNEVYEILTSPRNSCVLTNSDVGGITRSDFVLLMHHYQPSRGESEVMCMFKAMLGSNNQQRQQSHDQTITRESFLSFYEVRDLKWKQVKGGKRVPWYKHIRKDIQWLFTVFRRVEICHKLVQYEVFKLVTNLVILSNALVVAAYVVAFDDHSDPDERIVTFRKFLPFSAAFVAIYCVEVILRMIGDGVYDFFRKPWNVVDFLVIFVSLICVLLELADQRFAFLAIVRPIKLFRLLKFKRKYRHIVSIVIILIPRLLSVGVFAAIVYYVYSIVGIEFLSGRVFPGCCGESWYGVGAHFVGDSVANTSAAAVETAPDIFYTMNFDSMLRSYVTLYTLMIINNWFIIMEGFASEVKPDWLVRLYFMSFIFTTLVIFEVALLFVVDGFELMVHPCQDHGEFYCHRCTDMDRKRVTLNQNDLTDLDEPHKKPTMKSNIISKWFKRSWRDYVREENEMTYVGHFPNTKHHIRLQMYRDEQQEWVNEIRDTNRRRKRKENESHTGQSFKTRMEHMRGAVWSYSKDIYRCITD